MVVREPSRPHRVKGFVSLKCSLGLFCALLLVLLLANLFLRPRAEKGLDTRGWKLTDFLGHLERRGLQFHAVPTAQDGWPSDSAYLTENPDPTWASMQRKVRNVERIHQWRGTVWVGRADEVANLEDVLSDWGRHGCQVGDFILFGDQRILRQIQEACR